MSTDVAKNLHKVLNSLPTGVDLVAVSKFHPANEIRVAYDEGQRKNALRKLPPFQRTYNGTSSGICKPTKYATSLPTLQW